MELSKAKIENIFNKNEEEYYIRIIYNQNRME